jgi:hypothetical protein
MKFDGRRLGKKKRSVKGKQIWRMKGLKGIEKSTRKGNEGDTKLRKKRGEQENRRN